MANKGIGGIGTPFLKIHNGGKGEETTGGGGSGGGDGGDGPPTHEGSGLLMIDAATPLRARELGFARHHVNKLKRFFCYGNKLVEIDEVPAVGLYADTEKTTVARFPQPAVVKKDRAHSGLEEAVFFFKQNAASGNIRRVSVPDWAGSMLANGSAGDFEPLAGVISHPVLTEENKLLAGKIGYHTPTQYYIDAPTVGDPGEHQWKNAEHAYLWLTEFWLQEVAFATKADAARAILYCATLLKGRTCLMREQKFPAFFITAPMASSGKTKLIENLTYAITGKSLPFAAFPTDNEEEMNKLLLSYASQDPPVFCFDNVPNGQSIKSANLDAFITNDLYGGRLLSTNEAPNFPANCVVTATGNNIEVQEDSKTRWVEIRLEPDSTSPQNRVFKRDFNAMTRDNRAKILSALQRILQEPHDLQQTGRFPAWFKQVAGPVMQVSGEEKALSAWAEGGSTVANADAFEDFLNALDKWQTHTNLDCAFADDVVRDLLDELTALVNISDKDYEAATELLNPEASDAEKAKVSKRIENAKRRIKRGLNKRLKRWKDQGSGGFRLRMDQEQDPVQRKMRVAFRAEKISAPKENNDLPF